MLSEQQRPGGASRGVLGAGGGPGAGLAGDRGHRGGGQPGQPPRGQGRGRVCRHVRGHRGHRQQVQGEHLNANKFFCNNDVHIVQCMFGVSRADSTPFQWSSHLRILAQTSPSSLKSLARKVVRRQHMRKRSTCDKKLTTRLEMANMEDLVRYLDFRE